MASSLLTRGRHYFARIPEERAYFDSPHRSIWICHRICHPYPDDAVVQRKTRPLVILPEMADYR